MTITLNGTTGITTTGLTSTGIDDNATSTAITIDASENVGVGTASPSYKLHVSQASSGALVNSFADDLFVESSAHAGITIGSGATSTGNLAFTDSGNNFVGYVQYNHGDNSMRLGSNASEAMRIDSSGRVFIGKTSDNDNTAGHTLHSSGLVVHTRDQAFTAIFNRTTSDGDIAQFKKDGALVGSIYSYNGFLGIGSPSGNDAYLLLGSDFVAPATSTGTARDGAIDLGSTGRRFKDFYLNGFISGGGNTCITSRGVEFGGVTALKMQQSRGTIASPLISGGSGDGNYITSEVYNGTSFNSIGHIGIVTTNSTVNNSAMLFATANSGTVSERMRIDKDGTLLVGTTSSSPTTKVNITQSANEIATYIYASNPSFTSTVFVAQGDISTTNETYVIADFLNGAGTGRAKIYDSGDIDNTNNAYGALSDAKLKTEIIDASSQWDDIKALRFRKYKMIADPEQRVQMGVIAQEVEEAGMSGLVRETADKDLEGNDLGTTTKSVKYSVLYTKAIKALQEAMTRIETLEAEVAALKGSA